MPILLTDKILHRPYERAVDRVVGFIAKDLGYTDLRLNEHGALLGGGGKPVENLRRLDPDRIAMARYQHNRALETRAELKRKLRGNTKRARLSPANPVFIEREAVLRKLLGLLDAHPFAQKSAMRGAIRDAAGYGVGRRLGDEVFALHKAAGLFLREHRVAVLSTAVTLILLKLVIAHAYHEKKPSAKNVVALGES